MTDDIDAAAKIREDFQSYAASCRSGGKLKLEESSTQPIKANLTRLNLSKMSLRGKKSKRINLEDVDFSDSDLSGALFENVDMSFAKFVRADLTNTTFVGCYMTHSNLTDATLKGAKFLYCKLGRSLFPKNIEGVDFSESNLAFTDFSERKMNFAKLRWCKLWESCFVGADLSGALLADIDSQFGVGTLQSTTDLSGAVLDKSWLNMPKGPWPSGFVVIVYGGVQYVTFPKNKNTVVWILSTPSPVEGNKLIDVIDQLPTAVANMLRVNLDTETT
jgi:uncharacterized protein YjbI with pentapeptide repeats